MAVSEEDERAQALEETCRKLKRALEEYEEEKKAEEKRLHKSITTLLVKRALRMGFEKSVERKWYEDQEVLKKIWMRDVKGDEARRTATKLKDEWGTEMVDKLCGGALKEALLIISGALKEAKSTVEVHHLFNICI